MDTFDWLELQKGVEELGHGAVKFYLGDEEENLLELQVQKVLVLDDEVEVTLSE